jgi:very-short-patch-repair endonuclease
MESKTDRPPLTGQEFLQVTRAAIKKIAELTLRDVDEDLRAYPTLEIDDQIYKQSYWRKYISLHFDLCNQVSRTPTEQEKWDLILAIYGDQLPDLPSTGMRPDVKGRLDWLKRRIAKEFELEFTRQINTNAISSPIEQIFLLEWKFAGLDKKLNVLLSPQEPIPTDVGSFTVDFLIVPDNHNLEQVKVAIELDGHEFHERTRDQVRKDKARERAIVQQGVTVLRFSGSEIVRNGRGCVEEVEKFLRKTMRPAVVQTIGT